MNLIKRTSLVLALLLAVAGTASAQLRFGIKAGVQTNSLHFNTSTFDAGNRAGFTGGVMMEFTAPVVGIGMDLSVMYVHRTLDLITIDANGNQSEVDGRNYIEIPLHLKWRINIPVINSIIRPYVFTGPSFAVLTSKKAIAEGVKNRSCDVAWDLGAGVELFKHLQVSAGYGFGMTKAFETVGITGKDGLNSARTRCWTITAAYLF